MKPRLLLPALLVALGACHDHVHQPTLVVEPPALPRLVSIEVEVYDPVTGYVWQDVGVRVVEAYQEWSDCFCPTPYFDDWYYTDGFGVVYLSEYELADAEVGFALDAFGRAVLSPRLGADEAVVTLEIWSPTFVPVFVDVELSWDQPDVFVSVPFE